jgi:pyrimidine operon attenuation protein/uracil phosphoribosyltransferase
MGESEIRRALVRICHEIIEKNKGIKNLVLIGIKRRGDFIARRIADRIEKSAGKKILIGALDITLYRDDLQLVSETPIIESTDIPFDLSKKMIILVDDVLYTGRTLFWSTVDTGNYRFRQILWVRRYLQQRVRLSMFI